MRQKAPGDCSHVLYWKRDRLTQKRGRLSIDDLSGAEVIEQASFYRSLGGAPAVRFALQHKNIAGDHKIIAGELFELY
jgi:hypothetical protein